MNTSVSSPVDQRLRVDVAEQLERILADEHFVSSERSSRFLHYVVEQTLAGKAGEIKELVIATELYARAAPYDPKADSTVRVEASRVRGRLHGYYAQKGARDPIRITIPKGTYVPRFERAEPLEASVDVDASGIDSASPAAIEHQPRRRLIATACALLLLVGAGLALAWCPGATSAIDVTHAEVRRGDVHPDALAAWEEGNELLRQDPHSGVSSRGIPRTLDRAIERYELAVARSPQFPRGWASLAEAYEYASAFVGRQAAEDARRAEEAAQRAITLDPTLPEGHAMLALVRFYLRWDFAGADVEYRRAIELDPRAAWAIVEYADLLRETDRLEQAAAEIRKARLLQPALPVLAIKEAEILLDQGRTDASIATAAAAVELKDDSARAHVVLGTALETKGDVAQALAHFQRALEMNAQDRRALPALGYLLGRIGRGDEARAILRRLEDLNERVRACAYQVAVVHVGLGEHAQALDWLERAYQVRQMHVPFMVVDHRLKPLRESPRFQAIVRRLGLKIPSFALPRADVSD
jgi:tetratricopeptide (TPR) repeat protein